MKIGTTELIDHLGCCGHRIRTYPDPEADPHVWERA